MLAVSEEGEVVILFALHIYPNYLNTLCHFHWPRGWIILNFGFYCMTIVRDKSFQPYSGG